MTLNSAFWFFLYCHSKQSRGIPKRFFGAARLELSGNLWNGQTEKKKNSGRSRSERQQPKILGRFQVACPVSMELANRYIQSQELPSVRVARCLKRATSWNWFLNRPLGLGWSLSSETTSAVAETGSGVANAKRPCSTTD